MDAQLTIYVTLVSTSGVLNLFLSIYGYLKRHQYPNIATFFVLNTVATAIYCFGYAFSLTATTLEQLRFWNVVQYVGMPFAPPLGLLFVMQYLGISISRNKIIALLVIPALSLLADATNNYHHLLYRVYEIDPVLGAPYLYKEYGIWFVVHGIFMFSCMLIAFILLLSRWKETASAYKPQLLVLMGGQLIPMVTAFLFLVGVAPEGIDTVPIVIWIASAMFLWSVHSSRMLSILPIAKEKIFNNINDGVIVLDESCRLIEFNHACGRMLPTLERSMYGQHIEKLWQKLFAEPFPASFHQEDVLQDMHITLNGKAYIYQMRTSSFQQDRHRNGLLIILTDITELKQLQQQLEYQAYYDELTGIYNRRAFFQRAAQALLTSRDKRLPFTAILFDIDYFKKVNDTYGHQIGDQMLMHIAGIASAQKQPGMMLARYGGEEFVMALPGYTLAQGEALANTLREQIELTPLLVNHVAIPVTSSFGVAAVEAVNEQALSQILQYADEALYCAKRAGRNQVQLHRPA